MAPTLAVAAAAPVTVSIFAAIPSPPPPRAALLLPQSASVADLSRLTAYTAPVVRQRARVTSPYVPSSIWFRCWRVDSARAAGPEPAAGQGTAVKAAVRTKGLSGSRTRARAADAAAAAAVYGAEGADVTAAATGAEEAAVCVRSACACACVCPCALVCADACTDACADACAGACAVECASRGELVGLPLRAPLELLS
jgi:hypothetical protein